MRHDDLKRRELLKFTAGSVIAARVALAQEHKFFTPEEFRTVDELTEIIVPADAKSGGARAAGVASYLDAQLAEAFEDQERTSFRDGLAAVQQLSQKLNKTSFLNAMPKQREAVVLQMAANEKAPKAPEEIFFGRLKAATVHAYYTSRIGIHDDLNYKGNVYQYGEYAGILPNGPALGGTNESK